MTVLAIWPFYSQQDKLTSKFKLATCGAAKQLAFLADHVRDELGWHVRIALPVDREDEHPFGEHVTYSYYMPSNNPVMQVHWDVRALNEFFAGADVALLNHEMLAIPVRRLFPKLRVVTMCNLRPDNALYWESMRCSDLVVMQGEYAKEQCEMRLAATRPRVTYWSLAYDEEQFKQERAPDRDIDALFVQRCSASNYTHHEEFLRAMQEYFAHLKVVFTDVTGYLRQRRPELNYSTPEEYVSTLYRSKVAVALNDNWYGGLSIREAARCGCVPVVLDAPCYRELVGERWPFCIKDASPIWIGDAVQRAVCYKSMAHTDELWRNVRNESYQAGWSKVKSDLEQLLQRVPSEAR